MKPIAYAVIPLNCGCRSNAFRDFDKCVQPQLLSETLPAWASNNRQILHVCVCSSDSRRGRCYCGIVRDLMRFLNPIFSRGHIVCWATRGAGARARLISCSWEKTATDRDLMALMTTTLLKIRVRWRPMPKCFQPLYGSVHAVRIPGS